VDLGADPDDEVRRLTGAVRQQLEVGYGDIAQLPGPGQPDRTDPQRRTRAVGLGLLLHGEAVEDQHRHQPVHRGLGHAEVARGRAEAELAVVAQHLDQPQCAVDRGHHVGRHLARLLRLLHPRSIWPWFLQGNTVEEQA
jgi:hypothetical protein